MPRRLAQPESALLRVMQEPEHSQRAAVQSRQTIRAYITG